MDERARIADQLRRTLEGETGRPTSPSYSAWVNSLYVADSEAHRIRKVD